MIWFKQDSAFTAWYKKSPAQSFQMRFKEWTGNERLEVGLFSRKAICFLAGTQYIVAARHGVLRNVDIGPKSAYICMDINLQADHLMTYCQAGGTDQALGGF